jgi:hypothetical protein
MQAYCSNHFMDFLESTSLKNSHANLSISTPAIALTSTKRYIKILLPIYFTQQDPISLFLHVYNIIWNKHTTTITIRNTHSLPSASTHLLSSTSLSRLKRKNHYKGLERQIISTIHSRNLI